LDFAGPFTEMGVMGNFAIRIRMRFWVFRDIFWCLFLNHDIDLRLFGGFSGFLWVE